MPGRASMIFVVIVVDRTHQRRDAANSQRDQPVGLQVGAGRPTTREFA